MTLANLVTLLGAVGPVRGSWLAAIPRGPPGSRFEGIRPATDTDRALPSLRSLRLTRTAFLRTTGDRDEWSKHE